MTPDECNVAVAEALQGDEGGGAGDVTQPQAEAEAGAAAEGSAEGGAAPSLESLTEQLGGAIRGEAEGQAETEVQPEVQPEAAPEAQASEGQAPEVQADAPAETQPEPEAPAGQAEAPAETVPAETLPAPEAEAEAQAEAPVETPAPPQAEAQPEAQPEAQAEVQPEAQAETSVDPQPEAETAAEEDPSVLDRLVNALGGGSDEDAAAEGEAQTEATTEATPEEATTEAEAAPDATSETETAAEEEPSTLDRIVNALGGGSDSEAEAEGGADIIATEPSDAATEAATGEAEAPLAATEAGEVVEESTETVTEDNARLSSEDYARTDTTAAPEGEAAAPQQAQAQGQQEDDNFNRFLQGALVGAAGALVVGALLNDNREVVGTAPDRVVVRDRNGHLQVLRDDDAILRQPGSEVTTRRYSDGSSETVVQQRDGSQVVTVRNAEARVVKRVVIHPDGSRTVLFDDTQTYEPVVIADLPEPNRQAPRQVDPQDEQALRVALESQAPVDRAFSLNQIRQIDRVRYLAPAAQVQNITFDTGSAAISPNEARNLLALGELMTSMIAENPNEVFLIEGHTDAVGSDVMNLTLSDRRAESVARALTEYFGVSPANMVLQGYGESDLRIRTEAAERENRRVVVRRITPLLQVASN
ncbi:MAG: OmpA family protein [Proteobacteria bacterium]|nr:OmpA family protein [Pseudomonadota bacterium]